MTSKSELELERAKNEVLRKIGRNMLLFQQFEYMLKYIVSSGKISGYASEIKSKQRQWSEIVSGHTMGLLVGQFLENTLSGNEESSDIPEELKEAHLSFSYKIESDTSYYESKKDSLALIVAERNELVHNLLPSFNQSSIKSCLKIDQKLDLQRDKLLPEIDMLKGMIDCFDKLKKELAEILISDEGKKQFKLSSLRQKPLVMLLRDIATQAARPDGWTLLNTAGQLIRRHAPEEVDALNEKYGYKTLKKLILATELFDIIEEPTDKGGIRVLYRMKSDMELQNS